MEIGKARAATSRPSYSMTAPRVGSSCSRRASWTKLVAALGRWKPTRSAPSRPSTIADRQGSWVNSSNGGNGMCRKKPMVRSGRLLPEQRGDELQLVVVHPDDGALGRDRRRALGEALVDLDVGVPPGPVVLRLLDDVVVQRPQRGVGHALVVAVDLVLGELDRDQRDPAGLERLGGLAGRARPAHPGATLAGDERLERGDQAAGAALPRRAAVRRPGPGRREGGWRPRPRGCPPRRECASCPPYRPRPY